MSIPSSTDVLSLRTSVNDLRRAITGKKLAQLTEGVNKLYEIIDGDLIEKKANSERTEIILLLKSIEMMLEIILDRLPEQEKSSRIILKESQK